MIETTQENKTVVTLCADSYKLGHKDQYPKNIKNLFFSYIPRKSEKENGQGEKINYFIPLGFQRFIQNFIIERFNAEFFDRDWEAVRDEFVEAVAAHSRCSKDIIKTDHLEKLHKLGYLPIKIKAIPEGTAVPIGTPVLTIESVGEDSFWIPGWIETALLNATWMSCTAATIASVYKTIGLKYALKTCDDTSHLPFQFHNFGYRGQAGEDAAFLSGIGHDSCFMGSDTIPDIKVWKHYYNTPLDESICSIFATEHSVMEAWGDTIKATKHLIENVYTHGEFFSVVWDTWDYYGDLARLPEIKELILNREGKLVIRPDSGTPELIICGNPDAPEGSIERIGSMQYLWNLFGGTINSKGYKVLDPHIGLIYGEMITPERAELIFKKLEEQKFASSNIVFGIGSKAYAENTRDTFSVATKASYAIIDNEEKQLFKNPKTAGGSKKSKKGLVQVINENGKIKTIDELNRKEYDSYESVSLLKTVYADGHQYNKTTLAEIRERIDTFIKTRV